jgi:glyceraldehyde-3-phosphate dehydrogenase/erythrose-4-phosphate dehydrogenase
MEFYHLRLTMTKRNSSRRKTLFHEKISNLDWKSLNIDYVVESTGKYKTFDELNSHITAGAKK